MRSAALQQMFVRLRDLLCVKMSGSTTLRLKQQVFVLFRLRAAVFSGHLRRKGLRQFVNGHPDLERQQRRLRPECISII